MNPHKYQKEDPVLLQRMKLQVDNHPHPLIFASIHGSRLYGFDTPESDRDIKGCHMLPIDQVLGLDEHNLTLKRNDGGNPEVGVTSHDARKYFKLLQNDNGNIIEEVFSPLVLITTPIHQKLKIIARDCITRGHLNHYTGIAKQLILKRIETQDGADIKFALHLYRSLLTGLHLMKTGKLEVHLPTLNTEARLSHVDELLERRRTADPKRTVLNTDEIRLCRTEYERLRAEIEKAADVSPLPHHSGRYDKLNDLLINARKSGLTT